MSHPIPVVILLGAPGAGKGTQAANLSREKSIPKISTGDILRQAVTEDSELGQRVKSIMHNGQLVDDDTMLSLVVDRIGRPDAQQGFILDGYPRNIQQATQLEQVLKPGMKLKVINIEVSEEEIIRRLAGRRICPQCQRTYNVYSHKPQVDEKCDVDGATLLRRNDDAEEVVRKRMKTYCKETFPLIDYYKGQGILRIVNGVQPKDEITRQIMEICSTLG